jgi:hypothetical protein
MHHIKIPMEYTSSFLSFVIAYYTLTPFVHIRHHDMKFFSTQSLQYSVYCFRNYLDALSKGTFLSYSSYIKDYLCTNFLRGDFNIT